MNTSQTIEGTFYTDKKRAFRDIILSVTVIAFFFWFFGNNFKGIKEGWMDLFVFGIFALFLAVPVIGLFNASWRLILSSTPLFIINKTGFLSNFPKAYFDWEEVQYIVVKVKNFKPHQPTLFSPKLRQLIIVTKSERIFNFGEESTGRKSHFKRVYKIINIAYADTDQQALAQTLQRFFDKTKIHIRTPKLRSAGGDVTGGGVGDIS